jgi:hypothetical protein
MNWYALHVVSNHERNVQRELDYPKIEKLTTTNRGSVRSIERYRLNPK